MRIAVINGPNLNLLGERNTAVYGEISLEQVVSELRQRASEQDIELFDFQSNSEGAIIDTIQSLRDSCQGLIINAAGYSHSSVAIRDALEILDFPIIEVHISNIYAREKIRHRSLLSPVVTAVICGLGTAGYQVAFDSLVQQLECANL